MEPGGGAEDGLREEFEGAGSGGEGADDGQDAVLPVPAVGHAFVGKAAGGRAQAVEAVEGGGDSDGATWVGVSMLILQETRS